MRHSKSNAANLFHKIYETNSDVYVGKRCFATENLLYPTVLLSPLICRSFNENKSEALFLESLSYFWNTQIFGSEWIW